MATLTHYRPFRPMGSLRHELDRLFGDFFPGMGEEGDGEAFSAVWSPRMDLTETEHEFVVKLDLPGIEKEQVNVDIEDGRLAVSGDRKEEKKEDKENYLRMERTYGHFFRSIPLPKTAKVDEVKAEFHNGVLRIRIPKTEETKPRKVEII